jgi:hypothetical protein
VERELIDRFEAAMAGASVALGVALKSAPETMNRDRCSSLISGASSRAVGGI